MTVLPLGSGCCVGDADDSDNPAWTTTGADRTRYTASIGGDLGATIEQTKTSIALANLHDDVVTNIVIPNGQPSETPTTGIDGWSDYTEYGTPIDTDATTQVGGSIGYGWLGAKQRSNTAATAGFTLMGARLYNPLTGRFTSTDPVEGGSDTTYAYPTDPVNSFDLDGQRWYKRAWRGVKRVATSRRTWKIVGGVAGVGGCALTGGVLCAGYALAGAGVAAYASSKKRGSWGVHRKRFATNFGWNLAGSGVAGGARWGLTRAYRGVGVRTTRFSRGWISGHASLMGGAYTSCIRYRNRRCR